MLCLDKQREMFQDQIAKILYYGLKSLDELDTLEQKEKEEAKKQS